LYSQIFTFWPYSCTCSGGSVNNESYICIAVGIGTNHLRQGGLYRGSLLDGLLFV
jgi:hypothetical protein